jgi:hypothetical protein
VDPRPRLPLQIPACKKHARGIPDKTAQNTSTLLTGGVPAGTCFLNHNPKLCRLLTPSRSALECIENNVDIAKHREDERVMNADVVGQKTLQ